jgi:hypothetical protein
LSASGGAAVYRLLNPQLLIRGVIDASQDDLCVLK